MMWQRTAVLALLVSFGTGASCDDRASLDGMVGAMATALVRDCRAEVPDACPALRHVVASIEAVDRLDRTCDQGRSVACDDAAARRLSLQLAALDWQMRRRGFADGVPTDGIVLMPPGARPGATSRLRTQLPEDLPPEAVAVPAATDAEAFDAWLRR